MFHGVRVDIGAMIYTQVLNLGVIQKEGEKKRYKMADISLHHLWGSLESAHDAEEAEGKTCCCNSVQEGSSLA